MAANTLNILTPSVNNLTRADLRARGGARLRGGRRLGQDERAGVPGEVPGAPDADARGGGAAARLALRELRDHALPLQQARARPVLPDRSGRAGDGRQRDVLPDRDVLSARRAGDLSDARLPAVRGRGRDLGGRRRHEGARRPRTPRPRSPSRSRSSRPSSSTTSRFIGGDHPSIADIRLAATLEFLRAIDYDFPDWAEEYMSAMESALGDAYSEPAADVRGFVASVKS